MLTVKSGLQCGKVILMALLIGVSRSATASDIDFSPDGKQISFPGTSSLCAIFSDGGIVREIEGARGGKWANWSPDGKSILFAVEVSGRSTLKMYNTDKRVSRAIGADISRPSAWREDSKRFAAVHIKANSKAEVIVYNVQDSGITLRTDVDVMPSGSQMVWLPSTDDIAYLGVDGNVYTIEANEVHKITTSNDVIGLSLSGDGRSLVWSRRGPNLKYILLSVYSYDLRTRSAARVKFAERFDSINPNTQKYPSSVESVQMSGDGMHALIIVNVPDPKDHNFSWSEAHLVQSNGSNDRLVARDKVAANISTSFSRDGKYLAVMNGTIIKVVDCGTGTVKTIASLNN